MFFSFNNALQVWSWLGPVSDCSPASLTRCSLPWVWFYQRGWRTPLGTGSGSSCPSRFPLLSSWPFGGKSQLGAMPQGHEGISDLSLNFSQSVELLFIIICLLKFVMNSFISCQFLQHFMFVRVFNLNRDIKTVYNFLT